MGEGLGSILRDGWIVAPCLLEINMTSAREFESDNSTKTKKKGLVLWICANLKEWMRL
jgi:hypothetical protein